MSRPCFWANTAAKANILRLWLLLSLWDLVAVAAPKPRAAKKGKKAVKKSSGKQAKAMKTVKKNMKKGRK